MKVRLLATAVFYCGEFKGRMNEEFRGYHSQAPRGAEGPGGRLALFGG